MFRYPFNKYGFYDKIEDPIKQIFRRQKVFKDVELYSWDICNIVETTFAHFSYFCKANPFYFIDQYCREVRGIQYEIKHNNNFTDDSFMQDKYEAYRRLYEIQEYVEYTRKLNKAKLEHLQNEFHKSYRPFWVKTDICSDDCVEYKTEDYYYLEVNFWFEQGELMYDLKQVDYETNFNPLDIDDAMNKLDRQYAKEIIDYSGYIWN